MMKSAVIFACVLTLTVLACEFAAPNAEASRPPQSTSDLEQIGKWYTTDEPVQGLALPDKRRKFKALPGERIEFRTNDDTGTWSVMRCVDIQKTLEMEALNQPTTPKKLVPERGQKVRGEPVRNLFRSIGRCRCK